jgi:hypothetical protein
LKAPHRPVSARCWAGIRFCRPQVLQVRPTDISPLAKHSVFLGLTVIDPPGPSSFHFWHGVGQLLDPFSAIVSWIATRLLLL